jgi:hypothetical protein
MDGDEFESDGLMVRIALIEARLRLLILVVEGMIVAAVSALIAYFFKG